MDTEKVLTLEEELVSSSSLDRHDDLSVSILLYGIGETCNIGKSQPVLLSLIIRHRITAYTPP